MFQSCQAVTIMGPGFFFYPNAYASFTQGNITAISPDQTTITLTARPSIICRSGTGFGRCDDLSLLPEPCLPGCPLRGPKGFQTVPWKYGLV